MTKVTVKNLVKRFGAFTALKGCNLTVESGQLVTLLGPSGCGKTTLLRTIAGISDATSGEIHFDDRLMNDVPAERRNIGMVFQTYALFPHMTVFKNLAFGLEMHRVPRQQIAGRVQRALQLVELEEQAERYPRQLSGGQQQRVALARAVVIEPDLLLFDEPLSNLDARLRESLREDLKSLQTRLGVTSVYVTHDQAEAMALADHIVVMRQGHVVEQGDPETLYRKPKFRYTAEFLGNTNIVTAEIAGGGLRLPWGEIKPSSAPLPNKSGQALISLRPEDLLVTPAGDPDERADTTGRIHSVTFLGAEVRYTIEVGNQILRAQQAGSRATIMPAGTAVSIRLPEVLHTVLQDDLIGAEPIGEAA